MYETFTERAETLERAEKIVEQKYGKQAFIRTRRSVMIGGFLGLFQRPGIEVSGYIQKPSPRRIFSDEQHAKIIQNGVRRRQREESEHDGATKELMNRIEAVSTGLQTLTARIGEISTVPAGETGGAMERIQEILEEEDFSPRYIRELTARLRQECSIEELSDTGAALTKIQEWVTEGITITPWDDTKKRPRIVVLVGPTGVGKTTTIAKLAARYGAVPDQVSQVRVITIDTYRIGALQQIQKYCEIMDIPVHAAESEMDVKRYVAEYADADYIFIDTIGKNPNDVTRLAEVNQLVRASGGEVHLAISATTKYRDICDILRQFEPFNYSAVVVTKMDETTAVGGILSALHEKRKSVSLITDGQNVPQDITRAKKEHFLNRLPKITGRR